MIGRRSKTRGGVIAALDIGSSKVCCFVARMSGDTINVIGIGHQVAKGLRGGSVVDMEAAEAAILNAVSAAEQMAGETLCSVIVSLSAGQLASHTTAVDVEIAGHEVGDTDLRRVIDHGRQHNQRPERELIHAIPVAYTIDGSRGIRDPRGMFGARLGVNMHMITAAPAALRNLATCIGRCHLSVDGFVVSPYAAGLAVLVEDEMDLGATVIDMGGGTTSIAVFFDGNVIHVDGVPVGGNHITNDIARGLSTPVAHAERMKTLYG
ncbi:MAG: cell division protein FtsA, partial [Rhodospirillaceae bacterium]|nr:cell division protein FtsA [Rhodospirillaceae bacterium]